MARERALPDLVTRIRVKSDALDKAKAKAAATGAAIKAGMSTGTTHTLRFQQSLTTMLVHFAHVPPVVDTAARSIESMTSQGVGGLTLLGGAAAAGLGILAAGIGESISKYISLADKVENYKRVVGSSAEESGRMVQVFDDLGVAEETATAAMFKFSKAIEMSPDKLKALGVEVGHNADGTVDLAKSLLNVTDAYNRTSDAAKKNQILFTAFGKSGKDMIPILEQGSAHLQQLARDVHIIFTSEDLERAKRYKIELRDLQQGWESIWEAMGQKVVPVALDLMETQKREMFVLDGLQKALHDGTLSHLDYAEGQLNMEGPALRLKDALYKEYDEARKLKQGLDAQTQSTLDAAAADQELLDKTNKLVSAQRAQIDAGYALTLANLEVNESQDKITAAQKAYAAAVKEFGPHSAQARQAADDITRAQVAQGKAFLDAADAARKNQEQLDLQTLGHHDVAAEIQAEIDQLEKEALTLAPNSPLRKRLQEYIEQLAEIKANIHTRITAEYIQFAGHGPRALQHGGHMAAGEPAYVGYRDSELWIPDRPGTIYPHGATAAPASPAGGVNATVDVTGIEERLDALIAAVTTPPAGQSGVAAALYRAMQGAGVNRARGMVGG